MQLSAYPKIVFLTRCLDIGGVQTQLVELASGLHRAGWNVLVAVFYGGGVLEPPLRAAGVRLVSLEKRGRWDIVRCMWRLRRLLLSEQPDIAYGASDLHGLMLNVVRLRAKGISVVWAMPAADMDLSYYDWLARLEFRLGVVSSHLADLLIFNSQAGLDYHVLRGYARERAVVVPNGVDVDRYRPDERARAELRAEWGIGAGDKLVGLVGRLDPMKDHANFLRAAATVRASRPHTRFVCVGDGPADYRAGLHLLAEHLALGDRLIWAGERRDISRVYPALDLAVSASLSEGLPNVIVEAMACGVPCVVTDVGDCATVVGDTGWTCPRGDSAALARAMLRGLDALPVDAARIRERASVHYSLQNLLGSTAGHLLQLRAAVLP